MHPPYAPTVCAHRMRPPYAPTVCTHRTHPPYAPTVRTHRTHPPYAPTIRTHRMHPPYAPTVCTHRMQDAVTWTNLGALYLKTDRVKLANEAFNRAHSADPQYPPSWTGQGMVAQIVGNSFEALDHFRHSSELLFAVSCSTSLCGPYSSHPSIFLTAGELSLPCPLGVFQSVHPPPGQGSAPCLGAAAASDRASGATGSGRTGEAQQ